MVAKLIDLNFGFAAKKVVGELSDANFMCSWNFIRNYKICKKSCYP